MDAHAISIGVVGTRESPRVKYMEDSKMRKLSVLGVFFVSQLIFALPGAYAASVKVDVCHREGNGSFHLINISDNAVPAHRRHGDALPGEGVPTAPGNDFDSYVSDPNKP